MKSFSAVLFDLDGTLVDTQQYILKAFNYALKQQGFPPIDSKRLAEIASIPLHKCYPLLAPNGNLEKLIADHRGFQQKNVHLVKKYPKLLETIEALRKNNVKIAVVTSRYRKSSELSLQKTGLAKIVDALVAGDDVAESKPHPKPFTTAAQKLGERPGNCLVVGDSCLDIVGGKAAGCKTCRAVYGYAGKEPCNQKPDFEIKSIGEALAFVQEKKQKIRQ